MIIITVYYLSVMYIAVNAIDVMVNMWHIINSNFNFCHY